MMTSALQLPSESWSQVFSYSSWKDKSSMRCTCSHFKRSMDESRPSWRGFSVVSKDSSRYNRAFWRSSARRQSDSVSSRGGKKRDSKSLSVWLPALRASRSDSWRGKDVSESKRFRHLHRSTLTACSEPSLNSDFLVPSAQQSTQLSSCNVQLRCPAPQSSASISQSTALRSSSSHHDGCSQIPTLRGVLSQSANLRFSSWTMINYKRSSQDFFRPATGPAGGAFSQSSELQSSNYDAAVTPEVSQPSANLRSSSVFHSYSVPGPTCHSQTWSTSLQQLCSSSVHGGHPSAMYAGFLPSSLISSTLSVDLQPEDSHVVSFRAPKSQHSHLEPWSSSSSLIRLIPQSFPCLKTSAIRHHHVSDEDFSGLHELQHLNTSEVSDSFYRPDPNDANWIVFKPSPRSRQLISDLERLTNYKVRVITSSHSDPLTCGCI